MVKLEAQANEFKEKSEPILTEISNLRNATIIPLLFHTQVGISPQIVTMIFDQLLTLKKQDLLEGNVDVILFCRGGDLDDAYHIGKMLQSVVKEKLRFIVPRYAKSAATLLTCAGDEACLEDSSELGPISPQVEVSEGRYVSVESVRDSLHLLLDALAPPAITAPITSRVVPENVARVLFSKIPLLELGDLDRLNDHAENLVFELLTARMMKNEREKAKKIASTLVRGFKSHAKVLTIDELERLGVKVSRLPPEQWERVWDLHKAWEEIATIKIEEGAPIVDFKVGNGIIFIA